MSWWDDLIAGARRQLGGVQGSITFGGGQPTAGGVTVGAYPGPSYQLITVVLVVILAIVLFRER